MLEIAYKPSTTHIDEMLVDVVVDAVESDDVWATDNAPDRVQLVEPRTELTGWPEHLQVGTPAVFSATLTNTTPLDYLILAPALELNRTSSDNEKVLIERLDGETWTKVSGPSNNYYWFYSYGYPSLKPGDTYTATLRITFTDAAAAGEQGYIYSLGVTAIGRTIAGSVYPYTIS